MSNYTIDNLISATVGSGRIPAIKVGDQVFPMLVSGGVDFSSVTATTSTVINGALFYDSNGELAEGNMPFILGSEITPTTSSQTISGGVYLYEDITVLGDAALVASNIVSGASIFGVSGNVDVGVDVSDTTAAAADVLSGKVFYTSGGVQTSGTIPVNPGSTITPSTSPQTVSAGQYLSGGIVIPGDAALVAANIVSGVSIFGVSGTAESGGSTDFYRCASVTSGGSTWTGYRAVLSGGSYSFESGITSSGLSYGSAGFTPQVGKIYDAGAIVQVAKLYQGADASLVFHAPLTASASSAATGQTLIPTGTVTYQTEDGIACAYFDGSSRLSFEMDSLLTTLSFSAWFKYSSSGNDGNIIALGTPDSWGEFACIYCAVNNEQVGWSSWGDDQFYSCTADEWHHIAILADSSNGSVSIYIDGALAGTTYHSWNLQSLNGWIGGNGLSSYNYTGYIASARIYDRLLTSAEVAELAAEFTPTPSAS